MAGKLVKVATVGGRNLSDFFGYRVDNFDPYKYFDPGKRGGVTDLLRGGYKGLQKVNLLYSAEGLDTLYRKKDPIYMDMVGEFVERYRDYDIVILSSFNPIHPEILANELKKPVKILGFIDDPVSTYLRGVPYLWAVDGAFYISPSYSEKEWFAEKLPQWGCKKHHWWPLVPNMLEQEERDIRFFEDRDQDICYVGGAYGDKVDRLVVLKKRFGKNFQIFGRWPLKGYFGFVRCLYGKPSLFVKVPSLSNEERESVYHRTKIGFNMHLSVSPNETGNMRMYEIPAHGMMQVCDMGGVGSHEKIFSGGMEAVYYSNIDEAIALLERYLADDAERIRIARNGYERVRRDYRWASCYKALLDWAYSLAPPVRQQSS